LDERLLKKRDFENLADGIQFIVVEPLQDVLKVDNGLIPCNETRGGVSLWCDQYYPALLPRIRRTPRFISLGLCWLLRSRNLVLDEEHNLTPTIVRNHDLNVSLPQTANNRMPCRQQIQAGGLPFHDLQKEPVHKLG
jgi:hypothetical protein